MGEGHIKVRIGGIKWEGDVEAREMGIFGILR